MGWDTSYKTLQIFDFTKDCDISDVRPNVGSRRYSPGRMAAREVECPTCNAPVDACCRRKRGNVIRESNHIERVRVAASRKGSGKP